MILFEGKLGNPNFVYLHSQTLRARVTLPQRVTSAKVLLRGFDVAFADDDRNLKHLRVQLDLGFGDHPTEVEVIATLELADQSPIGELAQFQVSYTIVAE
jgi:hypothetical protein